MTEVGEGRFDEALGEHIRESKFFPMIAELRERCGMKKADKDSVEAMDHWIRLKKFVKANYYEDLGGLHGQERIPQRVSYAMTSVGGARAIYLMDLDSEPFKRKDFVEAYRLAPLHEQIQQAQLESVLPKFLDSGEDESPKERRSMNVTLVDIYADACAVYGQVPSQAGLDAWESVLREYQAHEVKRALQAWQANTTEILDFTKRIAER